MESDDDYYTVSECLSSKVSSYGSCTPTASDQDEEFDTDTVVREVLQTRKLMLSPVRGCVETSEYIYKDTPILRTEKQPKCRDVLELKVLELCPELTLLGETLEEASSLQAEHERVLEKIQEKQSPVNELLKKADHLIATQNTQPEVYAAMADSLGLAWKDVNDILQKRSYLLHLNVEYHRQAEVCMERIRTLEMLCHSYLPTDVESIKNHLDHIQEVRKSILEALMVALGNGTQLLDVLKEMQAKGTLDSRPGHNYHSISLAVSQVEHWLEKLHDKRHSLDIDCHERKTMLEKRLTISLLVTDLNLLENILSERRNSLEKVKNCLGDSQYECSKFTEVNSNLITEAKDIRDQALRVARATEQLVLTKGYMEEDYKFKAYKLLELATEYLEELNRRENLLDAAMKFFESAEKVLRAWETILQHSTDEQLASKNAYVTETVKRTGASVIQEGNLILKDLPEAEGVKRVVDELERKKQLILSIVMKDRDKYMESSEAVNTFSENYNKIFSWLVSLAESFLHEHNSMGTNLTEAREFLISHKTLQRDLRTRGIDINALVNSTSLPPLTYIDAETRVDLEGKSIVLKDHWTYLDRILEWRIQLSELYVKFYTSCEHLNIEFSNLDSVIGDHVDVSDQRLDSAHKYWTNILQLYIQLKNTGEKFLHQSSNSEDAHLELDVARDRVRSLLDTFADRKTRTTSVWETWQRASAENKLDKVLWSETMCESSKTVDWVSKLESQLYPVLKSEPSSVDRHISEVKQKLNNVLPEVQRAQDDIESRIKTAEELIGKGNIQGDNISIPPRLKELHNRLVGITTEYQNLLDMFLSFFNSLQEFHNTVKESERGRPADIFNYKLNEVEELLKKHNQSRQTVLDSFKTVYAENIRLMDKIKQQEPQISGEQDMYVVRHLMENERNLWDQSCETYCQRIEQQQQLSQFDNDLIQINNNLNDLSQQLSSTRGQYGANLASAKSASLAFHYFEKTILLLEQRIETFINAANSLMNFDHNKSEHIREELNKLKSRWDTFQAQVLESRNHIDLCVQYFTLINEAQDWFHEGSILLMNIARKSTEVKTSEEASALLKEIEIFLKPGDIRQDERLNQIHELSVQLFGEHAIAEVPQVVTENKELLDSFSLIAKELKSFDNKLKSREQYEINNEVNQIITNTYEEIITSTSMTNGLLQNEDNIPSSKKIKLEEINKSKPVIIIPLQDNTVDEGKQFTFECSIEGEPSKVSWFKDNISIDNNPDYQTSKIDNRYILTIEETFVEDSAKFTCRAENDSDFIETSAYLSVKECTPEHQISPSVFTKLLSDLLVKEGDACSLSCKAEGNPLPTVQWFKDDICIDNSPQYQITYNNGEALLKIEHTDSSYHSGKYTCVATNRLGSDTTSSKLLIDAQEKPGDGPTFVVPLSNVMARAGQKLKLECEVETNKPPILIWFHNGKVMKEIKDFKVSENRGKINLIIPEAYPKDAGTYSLTIKTEQGEATSSCQVSVKGILPNETSDSEIASDLEPIKPSIPLRLKEQTVLEGGSVHLKCIIVGQPEPEVIWYRDGRPVKESKDIQLLFQGDQCSLVIKEAFIEDAGEYKVVAINSAGEASSTCVLGVEPKPAPDIDELVVSPKFTKLLSDVLVREGDSITLECNADGCPKPDFKWIRNTVEIKPDQRITLSTDEDGTATLHIHNALAVDKGQYTVRAVNKAGEAKCFSHVIVKAISTFDAAVNPSTDKVHFEEKLEKPAFTETFSSDVNVFAGESVKFECIVVGKPTPKVRWLFNEKPVSGKSFLVSTSGDRQVLTIPEASPEHGGIVECVAENEAGKCRCVSSLKIKESEAVPLTMAYNGGGDLKHTVSEVYESSSKFESKQSTFMSSSSSISGDRAPKFKLDSFSLQSEKQSRQFGDNAPIQSESLRTEEYHNTDGKQSQHVSDLSSTNVSEEHQTSFFERGLYNQGGLIKDTSQKSLLERNISKQTRKEMAPRFVSAPQGKIAEQGKDVFLDAIIDSYPPSDITWSKNGIDLIPDGVKLKITSEVNKTRLDIKHLTVEDGGQYTCKAMNSAGGTSCTTDVIVKKNVFPPVMCRRLLPNTVAEGERVVLEIEVAGTPEPTVSWFKNNQPLSATSTLYRLRQQGSCSAVVIDKATTEHAGEYKVVAKNEGGEAVSCADLRVVQPLPDIGLNLLPTYAPNDNTDKVNVDYYKSIVPMNQSKQLNITSKTEENSHFSKSVFVQESTNSSKDVIMTVNRSEANDFDLNSNSANANYETTEKQISVQNENIENASITKKSALQFFKNVIEDNKVEKSSNSTIASSTGTYKRESPIDKFNNSSSNFASDVYNKTYNIEENVSNSSFKQSNDAEVILEPGPPPTFDYMPRVQSVKKDQMTERLRRLSTNQKLLSPEQIPSGAVRIFPDVTSEIKQEVVEESCIKKEVIKSGLSEDTITHTHIPTSYAPPTYGEPHVPLLRPQADIEVRPGSPRPSAEAISMEKLWTKAHSPHVQKTPVSYSPVHMKTYSSTESQSFVSETIEKNGELVKNESREEKQGSLKIDDGVKKVSESFSEISIRPTKHVEPPRNEIKRPASAQLFNEVSKDAFFGNKVQTQHFSEESSQIKKSTVFDVKSNISENIERNSFNAKSQNLQNNQSFDRNIQNTYQFLPERSIGPIKHVEPPNNDKIASNFTRSHSVESAKEKQWMSQSPVAFRGPPQNKTYSSFEAHSSFSKSLEKDGVLVASEHNEEGGRVVDDGVQKVYDSFSERSKLPTKFVDLSKNTNKSNSIKTMQKMFEQTGSSSMVSNVSSNVRPYSRIKSRASDSDFESEAELSKYNVEQKVSESFNSFESKMYSSKTQLQEIKSSTMIMQSPIKESGYAADTDEPRGFQSEAIVNNQTFNSKRNSGFQSASIKKAEFSESERRQPHRAHPMQWANQYNQHNRNQVRSPAKFVRGEFRESDYESDYECRIQPIWRPYDSESEEPVYKPVRPGFKTPIKKPEGSRHLQPVHSAPAPAVGAFELKPGSPPEIGFAPSPDVHRSVSFVESERDESVQRTTHFLSSDGRGHGTLERNAEAKRLQRVDEMRKRFEQKSLCPAESSSVQQTVSSQLAQDGTFTSPIYQKELNAAEHSDPSHSSPFFVTPLKDIAVVSGKTARFECIVQGEPVSEIVWSCNGQMLENSDCYQAQYRNGVCRLTIPRTYQFNAGSYSCTVSNYLGSSSTSADLRVSDSELVNPHNEDLVNCNIVIECKSNEYFIHEGFIVQQSTPKFGNDAAPPVFEQIFKNARFAQGGNAVFEGKVTGIPKPFVSWTRKGAPLLESNKYKMTYDQQTGNVVLTINQIGPGDEGEYTCSARNQYGEAICSVFIQPEGHTVQIPQGTYGSQRVQQTQNTLYTNNYSNIDEDFKVDTFEYRLLREVSFRQSVTKRYLGEEDVKFTSSAHQGPVVAPQVLQKPRNSKLVEGSNATFTVKVSTAKDTRLTWFKNGQRLVNGPKHQINFTNQVATLYIPQVCCEDSGHYTLLVENPQGCVVSSAYLAIEPTPIPYYDRTEDKENVITKTHNKLESIEVVEGKMLAPNFVRVCGDRDVTEGKLTRFDVRVTGKPYPEVSWYINGQQIKDDATHKILVNESGDHGLMITNVSQADAGQVVCVARSKSGETSFQCNLGVVEKELVVAPKFVQRFTPLNINEGETVTLSVRAVGTPIPRITWQKDGVNISEQPGMVSVWTEGGGSVLEIARASPTDAGWYQCTAQNTAGSTATRARLNIIRKPRPEDFSEDRRLRLPKPTRVIEPEPEPEPEVVFLKHVERAKYHTPRPEEDKIYPPPRFIVPLANISQQEDGRIHFEARIEPIGDPTMVAEWFVNGYPLQASSRAMTLLNYGFIALDLLSIIPEDAGEYTCRVTSSSGIAQSTAVLKVEGKDEIDKSSQYPDSLKYIEQLEDYSKYQRSDSYDEVQPLPPTLVKSLHDMGNLQEGRNAHFEAQLNPVSDPTMKVEWYKDGKPITASSRITTIFNFGYVSLNIMHLRAEDSGEYTLRAINRWGEIISTSTLNVIAHSSITGDLGYPEQQRYIDQTEALEQSYLQQKNQEYKISAPESVAPPQFKTPIKDQQNIKEGGFAHFEARLEPLGDSTLQVEWLKDGKPVEASSRMTVFFNFGYVALTMKYVTVFDIGTYTCRAFNNLGDASTSATLTVLTKKDVVQDSQHPGGLERFQYLEDSRKNKRKAEEETIVTQKPRFLGPLKGTNKIAEGQRAHFEVRVEPQNDVTMKIEWYFNGRVIMSANRIQTYHDFGYVALDILGVRAEDSGTYVVVARNALGEAQLSATMEVEVRSNIDTSTMHRGVVEKAPYLESKKFTEPQYDIEEISKSKPIFIQPLSDPAPLNEGKNVHLECRLEPMGDPTMRVEWFQNGKPVTVGSRFRTYYDFGYVALDIIHVTSIDSGEYTVRATNHLGSAHTSACVNVLCRSDILTESQNEYALEQIQMLEDASRYQKMTTEEESIMQAPQFTKPLHNIQTSEGTNVHLECRLKPVGDPTMKIDWLVNGRPVKTGHRFRPAYDFDYVALDLLSVYPEDSGVYTCQARNEMGEAVTSSSVKVIAKQNLILDSQHPHGLEKIQYLEDSARYKKAEMIEESVKIKPRFLTKPKNVDNLKEGQHAHFECKLEPVTDSNLEVQWFKNGKPIIIGHRFRPIHDFGYVALDIIDVIEEDTGTYTCRAVNLLGVDETNVHLTCRSSSGIVTDTQNEMGLEQIQYLEEKSRYNRREDIEETTTQAPIFTTSLKHCDIKEGQRAHFECRLIPVSDNTMKVEWFHNNVPIKFGSRFTETNNFGFVALDILQCLPEDSGTYTCRATNWLGQSITSGNLNVQSRKSIYLESQHEDALGRLAQLENSNRYQRQSVIEDAVTQAPVFTQPMRDITMIESQPAHFEARLIPVGDDKLKVEWLRNGIPIQASNRVSTMHDFGYVALNLKYVYPEDSGTYTCRAINDLGQAVTSATLNVHSKDSLQLESQHEAALDKLRQLEDSNRYKRVEQKEVEVTEAPKFIVPLNGTESLIEGQSAHYECRIEPYPDHTLQLEWLHNGKPLQTGHRFRTTYDFGFASLDVLSALPEDSGEYTCRAINKLGRAESSVKLGVQSRASIISDTQHQGALNKIQYLEDDSRFKRAAAEDVLMTEKPQFGRPLKNIEHLPEGRSVHLEATLIPVNDPTMKVEWYRNGIPIPQGHRFKTVYDFGFVALDVLYAYPEDSGTYMCKAKNAAGEAVTTCIVTVDSKSGLQLDTLDEDRLKKIKQLEAYERPTAQEAVFELQKPVFLTPLNSLELLKEGEHAHLETRIEPINDADLKIEWFVNGVAIKTGHRFKTTHDFGYVALDILYAYAEDSGTYMCKATNKKGEAVNTCQINVASRRSIYLETQHPDGLEKIRELEAQGRPAKLEINEPPPTAPTLTDLWGTTEVAEGKTAHFECQVKPVHDSKLKVEFFHNDKPLGSASRFHTTYDFGYISLDIGHVVPEDAGKYTVKATNELGQATSNINLLVQGGGSIILDSQRPEGLEKIKELEMAVPFKRADYSEPISKQRPMFTQPLQNIDSINEGQTAHFECRLIPIGDSSMTVEWFRNEKPLETSSRITKTYDFGYISLDISHVRDEDNGVYSCKATNALGEAVSTASMRVRTKSDIQLESQHPEGLKKIVELERGQEPLKREEAERSFEKPIFTQLLTGPSELIEGQHAHFECRVVPVGDPTLRFEWYVNGVELKMGSRFHVTNDFGFVTLDISSTVAEDSGVYTCKAINRAGEAVSSTSMKIKHRSSIIHEPLQPDAWEKIQLKEAEMNKVPEMFIDTRPQQAPVFTSHLQNQDHLAEGQHVHLEAQVEPRADPNLRIEWFKNGVTLTTGSRIRSTFDFGLVTLAINSLRPDDSAIYTCKASNLLGEAVSTCTLKISDSHWLLSNTLHPESLSKIEDLEKPHTGQVEGPEPVFESPVFISHLNNWECKEGNDVHFECQVEPSKDPTLKIDWFVNGKPLQSAARFKSAYDFGFVTLDIHHAYSEDSGIYTCRASNSKGQAVTTGTLKCTGLQGIHLDTQHPQGKTGLEKVQKVEDNLASKYQRQASLPEATFPKPIFVVPLEAEFILAESKPLHLEAQVEPKNDPNLKIEWYFNGKVLDLGSRFKTNNDFGFISLDLTDVYERDQGVYTCKAYNHSGETYTSTTVYCSSNKGLIEHTQHPKGEEGLEKIQSLEESLQRQKQGITDKETGHAPVFTSQFKDLGFLSEGEIAHYEASLTPVGDQKMVVEWFYNGNAIEASHRIRTIYAFGMVVLEILGTKIADTGTYTCRATNDYGSAEMSVTLECVERITGQKPKFTSQIQTLIGLKDGDSAHFECTLIPVNDPDLKVEWFHNGQPLLHKNRVKMISDFGFVVMDIAYIQNHDSGEYVCKASNKYGEDITKATIQYSGKGGVYLDSLQPTSLARIRELENATGQPVGFASSPVLEAPKFTTQLVDIPNLKEGQSAHFEARVTPVNDPNLVVEWYFNGEKLQHGHRFRTFHDFGIVILDILYCYEENSGVYECRASNKAGTDSTKANLRCSSKTNLILDSQLPRGMEGGLEKIQTLEDLTLRVKDERVSVENRQAPMFTEPLSNIDSLREGESAHFEGRLIPIDDPNLKVEWFWNGKPLKAGSRFRTFCEFGFVILEISPVYPEDSGEYSCRASNHYGEAVTTASMKVQGKRSIIFESQLPKGMDTTIDRIAELEGLGKSRATIETEDDLGRAPEFITTPGDLSLSENSLAHFECRLVPSNDASMTVTWFHNGKVLSAGSRIKTINDFGFVILEVAGVYIRDSGLYTCKATNKHGEATVTCKLQVKGRQGIVLEPQLPNTFRSGTKSIQKLEENMYKREEILAEDEKPNPPRFTVELKDALDVQEAKSVHFECRVEPVNDSTLRIDWFFNGKPFATGSRVHVINDFGFISLDMDYVYSRDSGEYICRATNKWGTAFTKAKLTCIAKQNVILESQLPEGMSGEKLKALEQGPVQEKKIHDEIEAMPPKFLSQIESTTVEEASSVHFETRVEPKNDPKLRVEWYRNGKPLPSGHRYKSIFDLGFVSLDILSMYSEDSGEYICRAVNDHGEAITKAMVTCKQLPTILLQNQVPKGMKKSEALTQMEAAIKKYTSEIHLTIDDLYEVEKKQPPRFVTQIKDQLSLVEMESTKFECQLAPVGDPNMKVEWFLNGKPLRHKNRFNPIYDFGYVAMNFGWIYPEDSGEYVCRATNLYGQDETRATIKTSGKPGIIYDSQLPKGMKSIEKIREMEASWQVTPEMKEEEEKRREPPQFVSKPEPVTICEGDWARFCCRVTGFPRPRVMWLVNGNTVVNGMRYKLNYDGMWHLDIPKTRQYDHGKVEVIARNACGETRVETMLTVNSRHDDYRGVLKNSPRPWYDSDLVQYQRDLKENELEKVFTDRASNVQNVDYSNMIISTVGDQMKQKQLNEAKPEWTEAVKQKKNEDYYSKLSKLEGDQVVKEARIREANHQVTLAGEKLKTTSKNMSKNYEESLDKDKKEELMPWQKTKLLKARGGDQSQQIPDPSESSVHGKEIHVAKQQQTQKEIQGDKEIRRKITATETTEVEHTQKNQERVVQGKVEPSKPPIFTTKIQPCRAFEQDQARFEVEFDGEPIPTIKWYREDFLIQNSPDFQIHTFSTKSILVIRQVFMEDSGVFAVIAENRGGKAKCSANLLVEERKQVGRKGPGPPSFLTTMQGAVVKAGQLVRFDVKISANKPLDVYWLKNGKKITQDIRYKTVDEDNQYTLLIIESVTEDSGTYECVAINNSGEARCEAPLVVQPLEQKDKPKSKPSGKEQAPTITQPLSGQVIHEGQPVTFSCKISGQPPISVKWQKGDKVIKPSKYFRMTQDGETVSLHISEVFPEDEGTYKCLVSNAGGQAVLSANLKVIVPENQDVAPTLSPMRDVIVPEGNSAQFRTQVSGQPSPSVQWFREGTLIPETPDFKMMYEGNMAVLLITSTYEEDSGVFTCRATNSAGQVETSAKLTVKSKK